jgi:hypothetical protein
MAKKGTPIVMVSSSVYGYEATLDQIYAALLGFGYRAWMSHNDTLPHDSKYSNFENCLRAVRRCDAFVGIIRGKYGSGKTSRNRSITHRELLEAIKQKKRRWVFVDYDVVVARSLLKQFRVDTAGKKTSIDFQPTPHLDDLRVIDMYEDAMQTGVRLEKRKGNWVQQYRSLADLLAMLEAQLSNPHALWPRRTF